MVDKKISELPTITQADIASGDWIPVVDSSTNTTKKYNFGDTKVDVTAFFNSTDSYTAGTIVGTLAEGFAYRAVDTATATTVANAGGQVFEVLPSQDGSILFAAFNPDLTGASDVSSLLLKAIKRAVEYSTSIKGTSFSMQSSVDVDIPPGSLLLLASQVDVPNSELNYNLRCKGGRATFIGAGTKSNKGMVFEAVRNIVFENLNFTNFSTATEWDTNNIDSSLIRYIDCDWTDCNLGIDTVSYAASRSTVLVLDRCRAGGVIQLVKSYCDMLTINDGHYRNADDAGAFIYADSQLVINGGVFTPYEIAANARWIDIDNRVSGAQGSRSVTLNQVRFGTESGGIPIIYSWLDGNIAAGTRTTLTHINVNDCYTGSSAVSTPQATIVLMNNDAGTDTLAPNTISFKGGSINTTSGYVVTESGNPLLLDVGQFSISMDDAAQTRWGSETVAPSTPLVEADLEKFISHWRYENTTISDTGTITPSVGFKKRLVFNAASATDITDLTDALDGHMTTLLFRNSNVTVKDLSTSGSFDLAGSADFTGSAHNTLTVIYDRATGRWKEISRSVN